MNPLVSYEDGMFSNETLGEHLFVTAGELEATCYHEAAHAVVMYAFGKGLASIGVSGDWKNDTVGYGGNVQRRDKRDKYRVRGDYRRSHFVNGCCTAAGPAGERRFRYEREIPMRLLGASESDHQSIDIIAKAMQRHGRCRYAYRRLIWYAAQKIVARDDIWDAITELGSHLFEAACADEPEIKYTGKIWSYVEPHEAYRIFRQNGLRKGMFRPGYIAP